MAKPESALRRAMAFYGKKFSETQQIHILHSMLEEAKSTVNLNPDEPIYRALHACQKQLKLENQLQNAIVAVNELIITLETIDTEQTTINYMKTQGLYRILYRNPKILGQELPQNDDLHTLLRSGFLGVGISALAILFFVATAFCAAPVWLTAISAGLFTGASVYLSGILYGVVNDLFATQANLPYFLLGHQPQQTSLLRTNDKVAQGIAWGVAATFGPVVLATILFTVASTITAFFVPMATFILPITMIAMPLIAVGAEFYARSKARSYLKLAAERQRDLPLRGANDYQATGLAFMCPTNEERAAWYANSDRTMFGFTKVPFIGLAGLVSLITLSAVSMFLPTLLFASPIIAVAIPAACAGIACLALIAGGAYMYANRNKQVDDRYRLEFERTEIEPDLYFDEDLTYVNKLMAKYPMRNQESDEESPANSKVYTNLFGSIPKDTLIDETDLTPFPIN